MAVDSYEKLSLKFNISQLDRIIIALLNNGENKKFASNIMQLFSVFSESTYLNDFEKEVRVFLVKRIAQLIVEKNITEKDAILALIDTEGKYKKESIAILNNLYEADLNENEIKVLDKMISDQLKYNYLDRSADNIIDRLTNLKAENYEDFGEMINLINSDIEVLSKRLRESKESLEDAKLKVSFSNRSLVNELERIIHEERNPASKVKTGIRSLNDLLNGGFEKGRLYVALAVAKGWKSAFLLNACLWAKKYNSFSLKDPTKRPVILYLSMENSVKETIERVWYATFGNNCDFSKYDSNVAAEMLENSGIFTPNEPNSPELIIEYRSNKSINTNDLIGILDDLEREGKECVFLVLDYIKRIRSITPNKEIRLELGQVTDELCSIAKNRDIPVLSASQLNREAFRSLDEASTFEAKAAAIERLGSANVGESIDIIQNSDCAFILNRLQNTKYNEQGEIEFCDRFLAIKLIASRTKQPKYISLKHPFREGYDLAVVEDINMPTSVSILDNVDLIREKMNKSGVKTTGARRIAE